MVLIAVVVIVDSGTSCIHFLIMIGQDILINDTRIINIQYIVIINIINFLIFSLKLIRC